MAFSEIYDITFPPDTQAANQLGPDIRNFKNDIAQRVANLSGTTVAAAEALGFETNFYGAPFIDSSTGKVYNIGGTFSEITPLILANLSEPNTTLQAAIVAAIAGIPATSPGPLTLPALVGIQSPQITAGPGTDIPTVVTPPAYANSNQIPNTAWVLANTAPIVTNTGSIVVAKIPLTFVASPGGAVVTYLTIQGGLTSGPSDITVPFTPAYLSTPGFVAANYSTSGSGSSTIKSVGPTQAVVAVGSGATGICWIAFGVTN